LDLLPLHKSPNYNPDLASLPIPFIVARFYFDLDLERDLLYDLLLLRLDDLEPLLFLFPAGEREREVE